MRFFKLNISTDLFSQATTDRVESYLKALNPKKAAPGNDKIPPKLLKLSANVLVRSLSEAIKNNLKKTLSP